MLLLSVCSTLLLAVVPGPQRVDFGEYPLRAGGVIEGCHVDYQWFGKPESDGTNVIIVPTWFSGDAQEVGRRMAHSGLVDDERLGPACRTANASWAEGLPDSWCRPDGAISCPAGCRLDDTRCALLLEYADSAVAFFDAALVGGAQIGT